MIQANQMGLGLQAEAESMEAAIERFVLGFAHRSRARRVDAAEFERSVRGYAQARAIAHDVPLVLGADDLVRLRTLFREKRGEAVRRRAA